MPGRILLRTSSSASAASSFASRMRSISWSVLIVRASTSSGVASTRFGNESNQAAVYVVVVALHQQEVRQVEDVVGRADDERVDVLLCHQLANARELRLVASPTHAAGATMTSRCPSRSRNLVIRSPHAWSAGASTSSAP